MADWRSESRDWNGKSHEEMEIGRRIRNEWRKD